MWPRGVRTAWPPLRNPNGSLTQLDTFATGQVATCWIAAVGGKLYLSNALSDTLTGVAVARRNADRPRQHADRQGPHRCSRTARRPLPLRADRRGRECRRVPYQSRRVSGVGRLGNCPERGGRRRHRRPQARHLTSAVVTGQDCGSCPPCVRDVTRPPRNDLRVRVRELEDTGGGRGVQYGVAGRRCRAAAGGFPGKMYRCFTARGDVAGRADQAGRGCEELAAARRGVQPGAVVLPRVCRGKGEAQMIQG